MQDFHRKSIFSVIIGNAAIFPYAQNAFWKNRDFTRPHLIWVSELAQKKGFWKGGGLWENAGEKVPFQNVDFGKTGPCMG